MQTVESSYYLKGTFEAIKNSMAVKSDTLTLVSELVKVNDFTYKADFKIGPYKGANVTRLTEAIEEAIARAGEQVEVNRTGTSITSPVY